MADPVEKGWKWDDDSAPHNLTNPDAFPDLPTLPKTPGAHRMRGGNQDEDDETEGVSVTKKGNKDECKKGSKEKTKKGKEPKKGNEEAEEAEEAADTKIVVTKKEFKNIKNIIDKGLVEQGTKRCTYTIDFLTALSDALKYYVADDEDHTEFVSKFQKAWKEQHARAGVDMAEVVRDTSTVDYQTLKDFNDAPGAVHKNKAEKASKDKVKKGKEAKKEKEEPEGAERESQDKVKKGKESKKEKEEPEKAEKGSQERVKKGKEPKKEKEKPEKAEKVSKDKGKKKKEPKNEEDEPEEAEDAKIVIPEMVVERIKAIVVKGLDEQHAKGMQGHSLYIREFLGALCDSFDYYDSEDADHTEFVTRFHIAWKKKHVPSVNLAEILKGESSVDYKELKHFHDSFWDGANDKPKFTDLSWKGAKSPTAKSPVTPVSSDKNVEPMMRMGTRKKKSSENEETDQ